MIRLFACYRRRAQHSSPISNIVLIETQHGGHCAYLSRDRGDDIHWAEATVMRYLLQVAGQPGLIRRPMEADWEIEIGESGPVIEAHLGGLRRFACVPETSRRAVLKPAATGSG